MTFWDNLAWQSMWKGHAAIYGSISFFWVISYFCDECNVIYYWVEMCLGTASVLLGLWIVAAFMTDAVVKSDDADYNEDWGYFGAVGGTYFVVRLLCAWGVIELSGPAGEFYGWT